MNNRYNVAIVGLPDQATIIAEQVSHLLSESYGLNADIFSDTCEAKRGIESQKYNLLVLVDDMPFIDDNGEYFRHPETSEEFHLGLADFIKKSKKWSPNTRIVARTTSHEEAVRDLFDAGASYIYSDRVGAISFYNFMDNIFAQEFSEGRNLFSDCQ